jgi:hypothetical protein
MADGNNLSTTRNSPVIDFTSLDFDAVKADLTTYAQAKYADKWTDFNEDHGAVMMLELVAYTADLLSFGMNAAVREAFVATATKRSNLDRVTRPFGYDAGGKPAATATLTLTLDAGAVYPLAISLTDVFSNGDSNDEVFFVPVQAESISAADALAAGYSWDIDVVEGQYYANFLVGMSNGGTLQRFQLPFKDIEDGSLVVRVAGVEWTKVDLFAGSNETDTHYRVIRQDDGKYFLLFGDNEFGAAPAMSTEIRADFRIGGGRRGNLAAGEIDTVVTADPGVLSVTNADRSTGGNNGMTIRQIRNAFSASLATQERAVTSVDAASLALRVTGVAKAKARPTRQPLTGANAGALWIAPSGGGAPTALLLSQVSSYLRDRKVIGRKIIPGSPTYVDLQIGVRLYVSPRYNAEEAKQAFTSAMVHAEGIGAFDFDQLDFAGVSESTDGSTDRFLTQSRVYDTALSDELRAFGITNIEIGLFSTLNPVVRERDGGNTGDGTVGTFVLSANRRRRRYIVKMTSANTFNVYEAQVGLVTGLTSSAITDDAKVVSFTDQGIGSYSGYKLVPDTANLSYEVTLTSASDYTLNVLAGGPSLYVLTDKMFEYLVYNPTPTAGTVGVQWTSADTYVRFTVAAGGTAFVAGDILFVDVYPKIGDIVLKYDEYPQLTTANLIVLTSGGAALWPRPSFTPTPPTRPATLRMTPLWSWSTRPTRPCCRRTRTWTSTAFRWWLGASFPPATTAPSLSMMTGLFTACRPPRLATSTWPLPSARTPTSSTARRSLLAEPSAPSREAPWPPSQ